MAVKRPHSKIWTYQDYLLIPEDGHRYEVIWGELVVAPSPLAIHQWVLGRLFSLLDAHVQAHGLGRVYPAPLDVVLAPKNVYQPDILYVSKKRLRIVTDTHVAGAPGLVVEVISPSTAALDRGEKLDGYAASGVPHYWIVSPRAHTLEEYRLEGGQYVLAQRLAGTETFKPVLFPGLEIPLADLWG